jgi:hypothetical protein
MVGAGVDEAVDQSHSSYAMEGIPTGASCISLNSKTFRDLQFNGVGER